MIIRQSKKKSFPLLISSQQVSLSGKSMWKFERAFSKFSYSLVSLHSCLTLCGCFSLRAVCFRQRVLSQMHISTKKINILQFFVSAHTDWRWKLKSRDKKKTFFGVIRKKWLASVVEFFNNTLNDKIENILIKNRENLTLCSAIKQQSSQ